MANYLINAGRFVNTVFSNNDGSDVEGQTKMTIKEFVDLYFFHDPAAFALLLQRLYDKDIDMNCLKGKQDTKIVVTSCTDEYDEDDIAMWEINATIAGEEICLMSDRPAWAE